ncbi:hypothetical protein ACQY0O_002818 [Thecaphora frezii]
MDADHPPHSPPTRIYAAPPRPPPPPQPTLPAAHAAPEPHPQATHTPAASPSQQQPVHPASPHATDVHRPQEASHQHAHALSAPQPSLPIAASDPPNQAPAPPPPPAEPERPAQASQHHEPRPASPAARADAADAHEAAPQFGLSHLLTSVLNSMRSMVPRSPTRDHPLAEADASAADIEAGAEAFEAQPTERPTATDADADADPTQGAQHPPREPRDPSTVLYFRMPFSGPDGNPALLTFHPLPLPRVPLARQNADQQPRDEQQQPPQAIATATATEASDRAQPTQQQPQPDAATGESEEPLAHPAGHVPRTPLFVPLGASPLPFSFIYDAPTSTAWPIAYVVPSSPLGGAPPDASGDSSQLSLMAGPPFRMHLDLHFVPVPEPEQPDAELAKAYVQGLERADAELRSRMARLGMGGIGAFARGGESGEGGEGDALLGCGICLDSYEAEDRPEWIAGEKGRDEAVVAVPCAGHHTLHAGCLRDWLSKTPPSQWTCPFCRAHLDAPPRPNRGADGAGGTDASAAAAAAAATSKVVGEAAAPRSTTTLRDEVRRRERQRGWRCDAPACLPRYPAASTGTGGDEAAAAAEPNDASDETAAQLVKLVPCQHEVHLDCLCTSMRVEAAACAALFDATDDEDEEQGDGARDAEEDEAEDARADERGQRGDGATVGKWVTCAACRKECWTRLPIRKQPKRANSAGVSKVAVGCVSGSSRGLGGR